MVIQCTQCKTRFKLADEKLKPGGIKVRCAKCKHIFAVSPPEPPVEQPVEPVVEPPPPEEEVDFGATKMEPVSAAAEEKVAPPAQAPEFSFEEEAVAPAAEESEFSFGEEAAEEGAAEFSFEEEAAEQGAAEFSFEEEPAEEGAAEFSFEEKAAEEGAEEFPFEEEAAEEGPAEFSFEEEAAEEGAAEFSFEEEAAEEGAAEFSFEEETAEEGAGEFSFEEEAAEEGAGEFSFEEEAAEEGAGEFSFEEEAGAPELAFEEEAGEEATGEFSFEEEVEAPEFPFEEEAAEEGAGEFSFEEEAGAPAAGKPEFSFEEEKPEGPGEFSFDESAMGFDIEEEPALAQGQPEPSDEFDFSEMTFGEEPQSAEPEPEEALVDTSAAFDQAAPATEIPAPKAAKQAPVPAAAPQKRKSPLSGLMIFTVALLVALSGAAGYFFWQGGTLDIDGIIARISGQSALEAPAGEIRLTGLSGVFITNRETGQMFMISGQAVNEYPEARSAIAVKGVLHDAAGKKVMQQTAFCGNPLDESTLRSLPFAKIEERMNNQFGDSLSNLNIDAGKSIPFTIVFRNLPADLAEFTVEVVDSKPGSKQ